MSDAKLKAFIKNFKNTEKSLRAQYLINDWMLQSNKRLNSHNELNLSDNAPGREKYLFGDVKKNHLNAAFEGKATEIVSARKLLRFKLRRVNLKDFNEKGDSVRAAFKIRLIND